MAGINNHAIGIFDSGLGGLTVVKEVMRRFPKESIVYFGDTARVPYGTKSKESIIRFSLENTGVLLKYKVKLIVVACNSSSSYALPALKKFSPVPVIDVIGPGVRAALRETRTGRVGVIATSATIASGRYTHFLQKDNPGVKVMTQECPLFVPLVEQGWLTKDVTRDIAREYLKPLCRKKIDTLILGCTHYPLLKSVIQKVVGPGVKLIDSAREVVRAMERVMEKDGLFSTGMKQEKQTFLVSDKPQSFERVAKKFLGRPLGEGVKHV